MKKVIKASTSINKAKVVLKKAKELMDFLDETPAGFLEEYDLVQLYEELVETIPGLSFAINSDSYDEDDVYDEDDDMRYFVD